MVPCHGVTVTESLEGADSRDADWFLLDYQKDKDVPRALVGHIQGALDELDTDENALLLFSGEWIAGHLPPYFPRLLRRSERSFVLVTNRRPRQRRDDWYSLQVFSQGNATQPSQSLMRCFHLDGDACERCRGRLALWSTDLLRGSRG